jgi:hypothetical protein
MFSLKMFTCPKNVIWDNIHVKDLKDGLKKVLLNSIVVVMFLFLTTPAVATA